MQVTLLRYSHSTSKAVSVLAQDNDNQPYFAPVKVDDIAALIDNIVVQKQEVTALCDFMKGNGRSALYTLVKAHGASLIESSKGDLFSPVEAHKHLDAKAWEKALELSGVINYMPQGKRKEWTALIESRQTPEFTVDAVVPTLMHLLESRMMYLAQTVSDIFFSLSGDHVTNHKYGFTKRMIMPSQFGKGEAEPTTAVKASIGDLRAVIAKFSQRPVASHKNTEAVIDACRYQLGQWYDLDGGALRIKVYKVGTVHLEVHESMAWELNQIMAAKYPDALPANVRMTPERRVNAPVLRTDLIHPDVVSVLAKPKAAYENIGTEHRERLQKMSHAIGFDMSYAFGRDKVQVREDVLAVLGYLGATEVVCHNYDLAVTFPDGVDGDTLIRDVILLGCLPEKVSHQFYPTTARLREKMQDRLALELGETLVEPNAGKGDLLIGLDEHKANTTCIEISEVHASILDAKGYNVHCGDFLELSKLYVGKFDAALLNPPYTKHQAKAHMYAAINTLNETGRAVGLLPASLIGKLSKDNVRFDYSEVFKGEFLDDGAKVNVVIVTAQKHAE